MLPQSSEYESQLLSWAIRFEEHRILIQTALALYSSLYLGSFNNVFIDRKVTLAFSLFPKLDPFRNDTPKQRSKQYAFESRLIRFRTAAAERDQDAFQYCGSKPPLYKFNPSSLPSALPTRTHFRNPYIFILFIRNGTGYYHLLIA